MLLQRDGRLSTECSPLRRRAQLLIVGAVVAMTASVLGVPEVSAQDPGVPRAERELRAERDRLQAEVASLRAQLRQLEKRLAPLGLVDVTEPVAGSELEPIAELVETSEAETADVAEAEEPVVAETVVAEVLPGERPPLFADIPVLADRFADPLLGTAQPSPSAPADAATAADSSYVVELVTRAIDLRGEREIAEQRLELSAQRYEGGAVPAGEVQIAKIQLDTTERKLTAVLQMIKGEREATSLELNSLAVSERDAPDPRALKARIVRLETRLRLLDSAR